MRRVDEVVRQRLIHIIAEIKLIGRHYRVIVAHEISERDREKKTEKGKVSQNNTYVTIC